MSDPNFSAIRARLRYETIEEFMDGYSRYISRGGMFVPMAAQKLKPVGTTVRFQFLLADGTSAMLGEGIVRQLKGLDKGSDGLVGMLVKFTKLSPDTKELVDQVVARKSGAHEMPSAPSVPAPSASDEPKEDTGVMEAEKADSLLEQSSHADDEATAGDDGFERPEQPTPVADEQETVERAADAYQREEQPTAERPVAEVAASSEADEYFGEQDSGANRLGDDSSAAIAEALADELSDPNEPSPAAEASQPDQEPLSSDSTAALDDDDAAPAQQEAAGADEPPEEQEPEALKETEGGIKVMAFDDEAVDEMAARDFEEFASGTEDEVDDMFDNVFGGGGDGDDGGLFGGGGGEEDGDFFGGGDEEDGDFFGGGDEEDGDVFAAEDESEAGLEVGSDAIVGAEAAAEPAEAPQAPPAEPEVSEETPESSPEAPQAPPAEPEVSAETPEPPAKAPQAPPAEPKVSEETPEPPPEAPPAEPEVSEETPEPPPETSAPAFEEADEPTPSIRENDGDSSERIQSLLSMEDDEEQEMKLNLGGGSLAEESSEAEEEEKDPDDSMESLLASAQQEIDEKKKQEEEEEDDKDILDELLGDEDLPPPGAGPSAFEVPQPKKKKKGGFISKFFGDKD